MVGGWEQKMAPPGAAPMRIFPLSADSVYLALPRALPHDSSPFFGRAAGVGISSKLNTNKVVVNVIKRYRKKSAKKVPPKN